MKQTTARPSRQPANPSLIDIARQASVSVATASLALNNHPRVSNRTKLRVLEVATRLGYVPDQTARRLLRSRLTQRTESFDQIGFINVDTVQSKLPLYSLALLRGVEQEVCAYGAAVVFIRLADLTSQEKIVRLMKAGWVDAWVVEGTVDDAAVQCLRDRQAPFVILGMHKCRLPVHNTNFDYRRAGALAAESLASLGHRRIGYLHGSMRHAYQHLLLEGFRSATAELGLDTDERLVELPPMQDKPPDPLTERLHRLLALKSKPTALFATEPGFGTAAIEILQDHGLRVPEDISVLGCELDIRSNPMHGLALVDMPMEEIGRAGVELLHEIVKKESIPMRQVLIAPELVPGPSCCALVSKKH